MTWIAWLTGFWYLPQGAGDRAKRPRLACREHTTCFPPCKADALTKKVEDLEAQHEEKVQRVEALTTELRCMMLAYHCREISNTQTNYLRIHCMKVHA